MATQKFRWWARSVPRPRPPLRRFRVADHSMEPGLRPGDGLIATNLIPVRRGQLRVFPHPHHRALWLVKRVGAVSLDTGRGASRPSTRFHAVSDNPDAVGAADSASFGPVDAAGSYRVVHRFRGLDRA